MKSTVRWTPLAAVLLGLLCWCSGGCQRSSAVPGAAHAAGRALYVLAAEPAEARSVGEVRQSLAAADAPVPVVVVGRVGGLSRPTWDPDRAAFMIADLSLADSVEDERAAHDAAPAHDADNCPFCRVKKKKELMGLALVQMVDAEDRVPAIDARQLLGLSDGDTIVVSGEARLDKLGALVVRSRGIYVRPRAEE